MDYGHKWTDKELKKLEKRISAEYTKAAAEMQKKVEKYYADFARKDEIKRKEVSEGKISQSEYTNWRRNQMLVGKRWEEMQANLAQDIHTVNMKTASMTRQFSYDAYAMNFNYGTFEAESGSGIDTAFTLYDRSTVERLIRDDPDMLPPPGKRVSRRIAEGKDVLWNKQVIQSVMTQSILQGESIPNIATRLAEAVGDTNRKAAIRNARTMTTGAENAGREDSYKRAESMGIKMQQMWIATLDGRTRHEHRQLDGQKRKVGEPFEVSGQKIMFPGDPKAAPYLVWNCRCTLIGIVANSDVEYYKERMDERATIKGYPGMTYEEWKKGKSEYGKGEKPEIPTKETKAETEKPAEIVLPEKETEKPEYTETLIPEFVPAKTKEEAVEYAHRFAKDVDFNGISLKNINIINETLNELTSKYPINQLDAITNKAKAVMSANYCRLTINGKSLGKVLDDGLKNFGLNQKADREAVERLKDALNGKISKSFREHIERDIARLENNLKFKRWGVNETYENHVKVVTIHEYGHILADQYFGQINDERANPNLKTNWSIRGMQTKWKDAYNKAKQTGDIYNLSQYGATNEREFFAESFAAYEMGEKLPDYIESLLKEVLTNGIMR